MSKAASPHLLSPPAPAPVLAPAQASLEMTLEALYRRRDVLDRAILSLEAYQRLEDSSSPNSLVGPPLSGLSRRPPTAARETTGGKDQSLVT